MTDIFVGIDVAFAKQKRLPICFCIWEDLKLVPICLSGALAATVPRGSGNRGALSATIVEQFACDVSRFFREFEKQQAFTIRRIAIDAPSAVRDNEKECRSAEAALRLRGISFIKTPTQGELGKACTEALSHLEAGGKESRIPYANQLWMLVGFALFKQLRKDWDCLEVYPQAAMHILGAATIPKKKPEGLRNQLRAVLQQTHWMQHCQEEALAQKKG